MIAFRFASRGRPTPASKKTSATTNRAHQTSTKPTQGDGTQIGGRKPVFSSGRRYCSCRFGVR